ncbi:hypothetical protein ACFQZ2_00780 [Streptomonospora algeriensis]|uniref:Uncharacterized protein n=1 Tax=Streptomonospora algeriensis TaxID=995084 RepID=A0ABW3BBY8_9ACTN
MSAVDRIVSLLPPNVSGRLVDAYHTSLVWAQAVARQTSKDPSSEPHWNILVQELQNTGWRLTGAATSLDREFPGEKTLAGALLKALAPYWPSETRLPRIDKVFDALKETARAAPEAGSADLRRLLGFWWSGSGFENHISIGFGNPRPSDSSISAHPVILRIDVSNLRSEKHPSGELDWTDWRTMFTPITSPSPISIGIREAEVTLREDKYDSLARNLHARMGEKEAEHIARATFLVFQATSPE